MAANMLMPTTISDCGGSQYKVFDKLGKGGFAVCYRTEVNGQSFALKVSRTNELNEKLRDKLITELQIHSKVRHANIVQFHRAFSVQDNTYIALELCTNGTLKEMLGNRGRISMPETRRFGLQLCGALHYLHSKRVIHRDIKTANILLDDQMNIKLADFGLAAVLVTDEEMGEVKRRVTVCGTPNYIAPEILHKKKGHDTKADIWSLGVLFYNMLTGCMPFSKPEDKGHDAVFKRVAEGSFSWPENAGKVLSATALDLVNRMLQTVDGDRPEALEVAYHEFFRLGLIPSKLEPSFVRTRPTWLKKSDPQDMRLNAKTISYETMLVMCGLDDGTIPRAPLVEIGQEIELVHPVTTSQAKHIPLSHLLLHEFNQGLVPTLPLNRIYEPFELSSQASSKIKTRKVPLSIKSIGGRKEVTKSSSTRTTESDPSPFIPKSDGTTLSLPGTDLGTAVTNIWSVMKGRASDIRSSAKGLPPRVIHSLETDKWGLGYVLADGSIGLLSQRRGPEKAVLIPRALQHFKAHSDPKKAPTVPKDALIHFYERQGQIVATPNSSPLPAQIKLLMDSSNNYPCIESDSATSSTKYKLDWSNQDPLHTERGRALSLWSRYATYLAAKVRIEELDTAAPPPTPDTYLAVWQMIGNVQAWYWIANPSSQDQGGYDFEFADHTKLAISPDGTEIRFTYHPESEMQLDGWPQTSMSRQLETLEVPLTTCVNCSSTKNVVIWRVLEANYFRPKLEFVRDVLLMWLGNKGVGQCGTQKMAYRGPLVDRQQQEDDLDKLKYCGLIL